MKETRPANVPFSLLIALILSSSAFHTQAYYHPEEGRWISRDPIEEEGLTLLLAVPIHANPAEVAGDAGQNLYLAVGNSFVNAIDPLGLFKWEIKVDGGVKKGTGVLIIEKGDSLSGISTGTGIPLATLLAANKGSDKIKVGQKLDLKGTTYTIKSVNFTHYCSGEANPTGPQGTCGCTGKKPGDKGYGECSDLSPAGAGTLAADWTKIPPGSTLSWTHKGVSLSGTVHDKGGAIKEFDIDVWCLSHKVALENGRYKEPATVTLPK